MKLVPQTVILFCGEKVELRSWYLDISDGKVKCFRSRWVSWSCLRFLRLTFNTLQLVLHQPWGTWFLKVRAVKSKHRFSGDMKGDSLTQPNKHLGTQHGEPCCCLSFTPHSTTGGPTPEMALTQCCLSQSHQFSVAHTACLTSKIIVPPDRLRCPVLVLLTLFLSQPIVGSADSKLFGRFAKIIFRWSLTSIKPPTKMQEARILIFLSQQKRLFF